MLSGLPPSPSGLATPESSATLIRLSRFLRAHAGQFALGLVRATAESVQQELLAWIRNYCDEHGLRAIVFERGETDQEDFLRRLMTEGTSSSVYVITGTERELLANGDLASALNRQRERLAHFLPGPLLVLLGDRAMDRLMVDAPDLMDWHAATFAFELAPVTIPPDRSRITPEISGRSTESVEGNIQVLRDQLISGGLSRTAEARTHLELARLYNSIRYSLPRDPSYGRRFALDESSDLARDAAKEAIRCFRELGGGNDFVHAQQLADALDILAEVEAHRGDRPFSLASAREAVMFRRAVSNAQSEESLSALAFSLDKVAAALTELGQLDEALRIRLEEELPVYEKLGDVRSRAVTRGKIAQIYAARGDYESAIQILESQVIPADIELGDEVGIAYDRAQLAMWLFDKSPGSKPRATELFHQSLTAARRMKLSVATQIEALMEERGITLP